MSPSLLDNLRALRRRSRASFRAVSHDSSSDSSNGASASEPSSGTITPPSLGRSDPALNLQLKPDMPLDTLAPLRPPQPRSVSAGVAANRYSVSGMVGLGSPPTRDGRPALPVSPYAPRVTNLSDNAWVFQKVVLLYGTIGDSQSLDGTLTVGRLDDSFPATHWPVRGSRFRALVYTAPGANRLRLDFASPRLANSGSSNPIHASHLTIHMLPAATSPPLQLAVLVAKDSQALADYEAPAPRSAKGKEVEGYGLDAAARKLRMAAYLWQAFTADQMWRNKLGRRAFRLEEEWAPGSASSRDKELGVMRSEARVHVVRVDRTEHELRSLSATDGGLQSAAGDALRIHFRPPPGQKLYVAAVVLDARLGELPGGPVDAGLCMALFGSDTLHAYPSSLEEVVPAFSADGSTPDEASSGMASVPSIAGAGLGVHLRQVGRILGSQSASANGPAAAEDPLRHFSRAFVVRSRSAKRRSALLTLAPEPSNNRDDDDAPAWPRLDCLRFRTHPCFRLPNDAPPHSDASVQAWPVEGAVVVAAAATGVAFVELYIGDVCRAWIEYPPDGPHLQRHVSLTEPELRARLPEDARKQPFRVAVWSHGGGRLDVDDFARLCQVKETSLKLDGKVAYRSVRIGRDAPPTRDLVFKSAADQKRIMNKVVVYRSDAGVLDGLEFVYDDESSQLVGRKDSCTTGIDAFDIDVRRGEYITGFFVRFSSRIDAVQILTSSGRRSPLFGSSRGGTAHTLIPPRGYNVCGVSFSSSAGPDAAGIAGFSVLISR